MPKPLMTGGFSSCGRSSRTKKDQPGPRAGGRRVRGTDRELPEDKVALVAERQVADLAQALLNIAALAELAADLVLELARRRWDVESEPDVGLELEWRPVPGPELLLGERRLVLLGRRSASRSAKQRDIAGGETERRTNGSWSLSAG
jgi:hypothetical protein